MSGALLDKTSLSEALARAEAAGEEELLRFLEALQADGVAAKERELGGAGLPIWKRDWAMSRLAHIRNVDDYMPQPVEPHAWSMVERGRPTWGDNPPKVDTWAAVPTPRAAEDAALALLLWNAIADRSQFDEAWDTLYDHGPVFGAVGFKWWWDKSRQRVLFGAVDPRALALDPLARYNHRYARVASTVYRVEVGELLGLYPELVGKLKPTPAADAAGDDDLSLGSGRDRGDRGRCRGAAADDRCCDVVEIYIDPDPLPEQRAVVGGEDAPPAPLPYADRPVIVYSFIPRVAVLNRDVVATGRQLATAQWWRTPDSWIGFGDYRVVAGLQIAHDQLAIRGHLHRLAEFFARLIAPVDTEIDTRDLHGRVNPILRPRDAETAAGLRYLGQPGVNPQTLEYIMTRPDVMRDILGSNELRPDFFDRQQTAYATAAIVRAMENRLRQKIRNMRPMIEDAVAGALRLTISSLAAAIDVPAAGRTVRLTPERLRQIDFSNIVIGTNLGQPGPLAKQARLASIQFVLESGAVDPAKAMPLAMRELIIDESDIAIKEQLKEELRTLLAPPPPPPPAAPKPDVPPPPPAPSAMSPEASLPMPPEPSPDLPPEAAAYGVSPTEQVLAALENLPAPGTRPGV